MSEFMAKEGPLDQGTLEMCLEKERRSITDLYRKP
jgi:hypothetical protein